MTRRLRQSGLACLLALSLSACGTFEVSIGTPPALNQELPPTALASPPATAEPTPAPLGLDSTSEAIRLRLLRSGDNWSTIWIDGTEMQIDPGPASASRAIRHQVWADQGSRAFRALAGPAQAPGTFVVSNGQMVTSINLETGASQAYSLPPSIYNPYVPPVAVSDVIQPHPMELVIGSPFASLIFPAGLAQRMGAFEPVAMETLAGREALVADWLTTDGRRASRYWIDTDRGTILRAQSFGKAGGDAIESELVINQVLFDEAFGPELFDPKPASVPGFSDAHGTPEPSTGVASPEAGASGSVYFFIEGLRPGEAPRLVRLPGACVAGGSPCPAPETIPAPFGTPFRLDAGTWAWSPGGARAAFVHQAADGNFPAELFVFESTASAWLELASYPAIDQLAWSGDGEKLAFRTQDGQGGAAVQVINRDGAEPRLLVEARPNQGSVLSLDGWLGGEVLVTASTVAGPGTTLAFDPLTAASRTPFEIQGRRPRLTPSPDGSRVALVALPPEGEGNSLEILTAAGETIARVGAFPRTIYPVTWSLDGAQLAFGVYDSINGEVLAAGADGSGLRSVFSGEAISQFAFSPDGSRLLIETGGDGRLVVVDLTSLESRLLQAPGLGLNTRWRLASWQPAAGE